MKEYNKLCESITMKKTVTTRYPKQITLSEEFIKSFHNEVNRFKQLNEDGNDQHIKHFDEKFLKALRFELNDMD